MDHGTLYRRCGCRDEATGRSLGAGCPGLEAPEHGSWYFSIDLPSAARERRRVRRGGFTTRVAAVAALEVLACPAAGPEPGLSTGEWLSRWLESRVSLRASTSRGYAAHVRSFGVFTRVKVDLTYKAIISTPLSAADIAVGEVASAVLNGLLTSPTSPTSS